MDINSVFALVPAMNRYSEILQNMKLDNKRTQEGLPSVSVSLIISNEGCVYCENKLAVPRLKVFADRWYKDRSSSPFMLEPPSLSLNLMRFSVGIKDASLPRNRTVYGVKKGVQDYFASDVRNLAPTKVCFVPLVGEPRVIKYDWAFEEELKDEYEKLGAEAYAAPWDWEQLALLYTALEASATDYDYPSSVFQSEELTHQYLTGNVNLSDGHFLVFYDAKENSIPSKPINLVINAPGLDLDSTTVYVEPRSIQSVSQCSVLMSGVVSSYLASTTPYDPRPFSSGSVDFALSWLTSYLGENPGEDQKWVAQRTFFTVVLPTMVVALHDEVELQKPVKSWYEDVMAEGIPSAVKGPPATALSVLVDDLSFVEDGAMAPLPSSAVPNVRVGLPPSMFGSDAKRELAMKAESLIASGRATTAKQLNEEPGARLLKEINELTDRLAAGDESNEWLMNQLVMRLQDQNAPVIFIREVVRTMSAMTFYGIPFAATDLAKYNFMVKEPEPGANLASFINSMSTYLDLVQRSQVYENMFLRTERI